MVARAAFLRSRKNAACSSGLSWICCRRLVAIRAASLACASAPRWSSGDHASGHHFANSATPLSAVRAAGRRGAGAPPAEARLLLWTRLKVQHAIRWRHLLIVLLLGGCVGRPTPPPIHRCAALPAVDTFLATSATTVPGALDSDPQRTTRLQTPFTDAVRALILGGGIAGE